MATSSPASPLSHLFGVGHLSSKHSFGPISLHPPKFFIGDPPVQFDILFYNLFSRLLRPAKQAMEVFCSPSTGMDGHTLINIKNIRGE